MTLKQTVSASLMYGAVVAFAVAAAAVPALLANENQTATMQKNLDETCRDIINGKKEADVLQHVGCYGRNGFNLHLR